jgi:DNA modification methylase
VTSFNNDTFAETKTPLKIEYVSVNFILEDPLNPRKISSSEFDALLAAIKRFGFTQPVLVRKSNGLIIAGNQRVRAARKLGIRRVPVIYIEITDSDSQLLNIALNKISGEFDADLLSRLFADLEFEYPDIDLSFSGFDQDEIDDLLNSLELAEKRDREETFELTDALMNAEVSKVRPGSIWRMGDHLLICGDSTLESTFDRLLIDKKADLLITDPPYNVNKRRVRKGQGTSEETIANDHLDQKEWEQFVDQWSSVVTKRVAGSMYIFMAMKEMNTVSSILERKGAHWSTTLIWAKRHFTLGRADYQRAYEPIWYGWPQGVTHRWYSDRSQSDVWHLDRSSASPLHPMMKPPEVLERAIENSSVVGDVVLDPFCGSGSSLIACERTGRVFRGVELDPVYVDIAVERWQSFTGLKAEMQM